MIRAPNFGVRRLARFGAVAIILLVVLPAIWFGVRYQHQLTFLAELRTFPGFFELKPVGPAFVRKFLGEPRMQGWDVLIGVSLADAEVSDAWLEAHRGDFQSLEWIDLTATPITQAGLEDALNLPKLKELYLLDTTIPAEAIAGLSQKHPAVTVRRMRKAQMATKMAKRPIHAGAITTARYSPEGDRLATGNGEGRVQIWDTSRRTIVSTLDAHAEWVFQTAWSPDGTTLATVGTDDALRLWDVETGFRLGEWLDNGGDLHGVRFSPDGARIYVAGDGGEIRVLARDGLQELQAWSGHSAAIPAIDLSPDGRILASVSRDDTVRLWETATGRELAVHADHQSDVYAVEFSPDGERLATAGYDRTIIVRDSRTGQGERTLADHTDWVFAVAFGPDGRTLASGSGDGTIRLWDVATGECRSALRRQRTVSALDFHPAADWLASAGIDGNVCLWNWRLAKLNHILRPPVRAGQTESPSGPDDDSAEEKIVTK